MTKKTKMRPLTHKESKSPKKIHEKKGKGKGKGKGKKKIVSNELPKVGVLTPIPETAATPILSAAPSYINLEDWLGMTDNDRETNWKTMGKEQKENLIVNIIMRVNIKLKGKSLLWQCKPSIDKSHGVDSDWYQVFTNTHILNNFEALFAKANTIVKAAQSNKLVIFDAENILRLTYYDFPKQERERLPETPTRPSIWEEPQILRLLTEIHKIDSKILIVFTIHEGRKFEQLQTIQSTYENKDNFILYNDRLRKFGVDDFMSYLISSLFGKAHSAPVIINPVVPILVEYVDALDAIKTSIPQAQEAERQAKLELNSKEKGAFWRKYESGHDPELFKEEQIVLQKTLRERKNDLAKLQSAHNRLLEQKEMAQRKGSKVSSHTLNFNHQGIQKNKLIPYICKEIRGVIQKSRNACNIIFTFDKYDDWLLPHHPHDSSKAVKVIPHPKYGVPKDITKLLEAAAAAAAGGRGGRGGGHQGGGSNNRKKSKKMKRSNRTKKTQRRY